MFSTLVTCYLFCGGAGAGALVVLCVLECLSRNPRSAAASFPDELFSRGWAVAACLLAVGVLCLLADIGRPDRVLGLLLSPIPGIMTVGAYSLAASLACALFFSALSWFDTLSVPRMAVLVAALAGVASGAVTMAYTGILLQGLASVLFWQTPFLPVLFVLSSLSCGIACLLLAAAFVETRHPFIGELARAVRIDGVLVAAEAAALAAYFVWALSAEGTALAAHALLDGPLSGVFWFGVVIVGLATPLVLEFFLSHGNRHSQLLWIALLVLAGGFALRVCIVGAADFDVTQMPDRLYGLSVLSSAAVEPAVL